MKIIYTLFSYFYFMIYTLGESLMDVIFETKTKIMAKAGGAMLNLAVSLGRCGLNVSLLTELGDDKVAEEITTFLNENKVDPSFIRNYHQQVTSLAIAFLDEKKKPTYSFYKSYPITRKLNFPNKFSQNDILAFGSIYSLDKKIRKQLIQIIERAKASDCFIIYDPNIRNAHHLEDEETMQSLMENLALADIIKGSDEDFENIFGEFDEEIVITKLREINKDAIIVFTRGELGAKIIYGKTIFTQEANKINLISTIGAGDNFTAGMIYSLSQINKEKRNTKLFSETELQSMLKMGINFSTEVCQSVDNYVSQKFANSL